MQTEVALLTQQVELLIKQFEKFEEKMDTYIEDTNTRIRALEDFKLTFVVKYSVYSSIALFLGSALSTLAYNLLIKSFFK